MDFNKQDMELIRSGLLLLISATQINRDLKLRAALPWLTPEDGSNLDTIHKASELLNKIKEAKGDFK